ncbi:MAG: pyridoxal phosphate-dependent aminotransferase [Rickettsiaceae bacterium]|nr:MAG: pyridoxal phosphate-dependent aminotransferase [Rickettsiaceae bacterium]
MSLISKRLKLIKPSPTLAVVQKAAQLKKEGRKIISLGAGEPDFDTPENIKIAAIEGIKNGFTKYTNVDGMPLLKEAIQAKFKRENRLEYSLNEIIASCGGKQVIYNLFMASLDPEDEVIIPAPYWVSYPDIVSLAGGIPVFVNCEITDHFKLKASYLKQHITTKTKWLILNSPSNPTGAAYSKEELLDIATMLRAYPNIYILSDDIYEHIIYDDFKFYSLVEIAPDLRDRVFIINGVSKSYSMTGWRIGYGAGPSDLIKAMTTIQSQSTSNPTSISQIAAIEALNGPQDYVKINAANFQAKRDLAIAILTSTQDIECFIPQGAFYLFPKCSNIFGSRSSQGIMIENSTVFAQYLLDEEGIAVVPGIAFGLEGYFRISYAASLIEIEEACTKIVQATKRLKRD